MSTGGGGAAGDGDEAPDFEAWARARGPALLKFAYLVTGDRGRAEEAVQDALVSVCPRWRRIVRGGNPEAYVRRSIVNADRALWRRFRRRETLVACVPLVAKIVDAILAAPEGSGPNGDWEDPLATQQPASMEECRKFMDAPGKPN